MRVSITNDLEKAAQMLGFSMEMTTFANIFEKANSALKIAGLEVNRQHVVAMRVRRP